MKIIARKSIAKYLIGLVIATYIASAQADVVTDWNLTTQNIIVPKGAQPGVYYALVHVAIYDAVNAIDGRYTTFAVKPIANTGGASKEAAAAAAAYRTLLGLFPDQSSALDAAYAISIATIADDVARNKGIAVGEEVAATWLALRAGDGREAAVPYAFGIEPGDYQRTPPAFPNPITPWLAKMKPFALQSAAQFRAYGPPDLTSHRYAEDFALVKSVGSLNSTDRTAEETEIARFYTENPSTFWARNIRDLTAAKNLNVTDSARLYAMLFVGFGDALIACWDSKYYFNSWRPITAIRAADTDGNPATEVDAAWLPLATTPPHPEYPAAHGCGSAQIAETLRHFFGTKYLQMTFTSTVPGTVPHVFYRTDDLVAEAGEARVFGGMHFPTSVNHGAKLGKRVARYVVSHHFKRVKKNH